MLENTTDYKGSGTPTTSDRMQNRISLSALLWLVGHQEWSQLEKELLTRGQQLDPKSASVLLSFCIHYKAPVNVVQSILDLHPTILTTDLCNRQQLPFKIAARSTIKTRICLEAARQRAIQQDQIHQEGNPQA